MIQPYGPRYAVHMHGKLLNTEIDTLDNSDDENSGIVLNQDEDICDSPLKINKVFYWDNISPSCPWWVY